MKRFYDLYRLWCEEQLKRDADVFDVIELHMTGMAQEKCIAVGTYYYLLFSGPLANSSSYSPLAQCSTARNETFIQSGGLLKAWRDL